MLYFFFFFGTASHIRGLLIIRIGVDVLGEAKVADLDHVVLGK